MSVKSAAVVASADVVLSPSRFRPFAAAKGSVVVDVGSLVADSPAVVLAVGSSQSDWLH